METAADKACIGTAGSLAGEYAKRNPTWSELPLEGKVERLREALIALTGQVDMAGKIATEAHALVVSHEHHPLRGLMQQANPRNFPFGATDWAPNAERVRRLLG